MISRSRTWRRSLHLGGMAAVVILVVAGVPIDRAVDDPFQEAEYSIWASVHGARPDAPPPVLIHGLLDVLPSVAAASACPDGRQLACVRLVNAGLALAAGGLMIAVLAMLVGLGTAPAMVASLPAMLLAGLVGAAAQSPVDTQQGTPGVRDLAVLAGLLAMARVAGAKQAASAWLPALGALTAMAPLWAYNRGLTLVLVTGVFTLALCAMQRSARPALLVGAGAAIMAVALVAGGGLPSIESALANVAYWRRNGAMWHGPGHPVDLAAAALVHLLALGFAAPPAWAAWRAGRPGPALIGSALAMTGGIYLAQALSRPDSAHLRWTLWPAVLLLAAGIEARLRERPTAASRQAGGSACVITALCALVLAARGPAQWRVGAGLLANARLLGTGLPADRALAGPDLVQAADLTHASGRCSFAANNAGLVHLLSGMPPCSRFWFGAYIAPDEQDGVIAELRATRPEIILWDAQAWWAHIDGRGFAARTPALSAWIDANYPLERRIGRLLLRTR